MHKILNFSLDTMTGDCAECGPIDVKKTYNSSRVRCGNAKRMSDKNFDKKRNKVRNIETYFGRPLEEITEARELFLIHQDFKCAICKDPITLDTGKLDHCHRTNKLRGLLCNQCNVGLGMFKDSKKSLTSAIEYLSSHH